MRIIPDKNVPVGVRRVLDKHEVRTFAGSNWHPQFENAFDAMVTSDQNIAYQQNLSGRKLALVVLGSNIWPLVRDHAAEITAKVNAAIPGSYDFVKRSVNPLQ